MRQKNLTPILWVSFIFFVIFIFFFVKPYYMFAQKVLGVSPIKILLGFGNFKKTDNKINVLLLGKAGGQFDGPELTDSITVISINLEKVSVNLISVPRDIWSPTLRDRINTAYAYGEAKKRGGGFLLSKAEISAIVGIPLHYAVVIDFEKFKELIDFLEGVEIDVDRAFDDFNFPVPGREDDLCGLDPGKIASDAAEYECRYEHLSFKKGLQHMDGITALKFVRSRHAQGEEGSDYARGQRQQKVINAIYEKTIRKVKNLNVSDLEKTYQLIDKLIERDITNMEAVSIWRRALFLKDVELKQSTLSRDLFEVPDSINYDGKYVLIPLDEDFQQIHKYVSCIIESHDNCKIRK